MYCFAAHLVKRILKGGSRCKELTGPLAGESSHVVARDNRKRKDRHQGLRIYPCIPIRSLKWDKIAKRLHGCNPKTVAFSS